MFTGLVFMVDDKMCCGIYYSKKKETNLLMARIGAEASVPARQKEGWQPMGFTGRRMKDYDFIAPEGYDSEENLACWGQLCIDFNPLAKASKKEK